MPRAKTPAAGTGVATVKFGLILAFFRTQPMEIAQFARELVNDAVKEREAKGKAVIAGRAKGADSQEAVDAATRSALAPGASAEAPARKKPGPPKGFGKKVKDGAAAGAGETAGAGQTTAAGEAVTEHTGTALPPQEGVLDLDK